MFEDSQSVFKMKYTTLTPNNFSSVESFFGNGQGKKYNLSSCWNACPNQFVTINLNLREPQVFLIMYSQETCCGLLSFNN